LAGALPQTPLRELTALHTAGGAYSAPPDPLAGSKGPTSKRMEGKEWRIRGGKGGGMGRGERRKKRGRKEGDGTGRGHPLVLAYTP